MADETPDTSVEGVEEPQQNPAETPDDLGDNGKKALEAERARAREADRRARQLEREIEKLRTASLSDQERAVAEAKAAGRQEAISEAGRRLARAEIRAAAAAAGLKVSDDDLDDLDMAKFVGDDGEPNSDAISARIKRWQRLAPESARPRGDVDQGRRGDNAPPSMNDLIRQAAGRG